MTKNAIKLKFYMVLTLVLLSGKAFSIESLEGFLVSAFDERFKVISPTKFKPSMEVIVENKTHVKLIGKLVLNKTKTIQFFTVMPQEYQKVTVSLKKDDILHFIPLSPAFQEVELIVGNKNYEIPPKK